MSITLNDDPARTCDTCRFRNKFKQTNVCPACENGSNWQGLRQPIPDTHPVDALQPYTRTDTESLARIRAEVEALRDEAQQKAESIPVSKAMNAGGLNNHGKAIGSRDAYQRVLTLIDGEAEK